MKFRPLVVGGLVAALAIAPVSSAWARDRDHFHGGPLFWPFAAAAAVVVGAATLVTLPFRALAGPPAYYPGPGYYAPQPAYYPPPQAYYPPPPPPSYYAPQPQAYYPPQPQAYYAPPPGYYAPPPGATVSPR